MNKPIKAGLAVAVLLGAGLYGQAALSGNVACGQTTAPTKAMPLMGSNFAPYCWPCIAALRTYGRVPAIDALTAAFADMETAHPDTTYIYGEIGFPDGGVFRPHRTHREGLSIDIMVPLKGGKTITTTPFNRFGYDVEFDTEGRGEDGEIDFKALADLIAAMQTQARQRGGDVRRVILAPDLQPELRQAMPSLFDRVAFNTRQAWVRHDDHIHVDFVFGCGD